MEWSTVLVPAVISALITAILAPVAAVWRGWLIPRAVVDRLIAVEQERSRESRGRESEWREAWRVSEAARELQATTTRDQIEVMRTATAVIRALPAAAPRDRGRG